MNWLVFTIWVYLMLVADKGLDELLEVQMVAPSFTLILAVFLSLWAAPATVPWTLLVLGVLQDLSYGHAAGSVSNLLLIGPHGLGYLAGGYVSIQLRGLVLRDSPVAMAVTVFAIGLFVHLVVVAMLTLRGLPILLVEPICAWSAADELVRRFFALLYTAAVSLPVGYVLIRSARLWRFSATKVGLGRSRRIT